MVSGPELLAADSFSPACLISSDSSDLTSLSVISHRCAVGLRSGVSGASQTFWVKLKSILEPFLLCGKIGHNR